MAKYNWARNDQTGSIFQVSRCKHLDHKEMTARIQAANKYNRFISQPYVELSKTGRIKNPADFKHINGVAMS